MKRKYFFSSALPKCCADKLEDLFLSGKLVSKISLLGSQIDRNTLSEHISHKNNLTCIDKIFVDSGAFAVHTGKAKSDVDDYIEYVKWNKWDGKLPTVLGGDSGTILDIGNITGSGQTAE